MRKNNNTLFGIIGGLGAHSSALLYKNIVNSIKDAKGDTDYPNLLIHSEGFSSFDEMAFLDKDAQQKLREIISKIEGFGCKKILVLCNSIYTQKDHWFNSETCIDWTEQFGKSFDTNSIVLCSNQSRKNRLYKNGVQVSDKEQELIDKCILAVIKGEHLTKENETRLLWNNIINKYKTDSIVLGCTELSVCADRFGCNNMKTYDSMAFVTNLIISEFNRNRYET